MVVSTGTAILGAAIIGGGAALIGGGTAARASREASAVQAASTEAALVEQRRQADISQANLAPFLATSTAANDALSRLFNLQPAPTAQPPAQAPGATAPVTRPRGISFRGSAAGDFTPGDFQESRLNTFAEDGRVSFGGGGQNQALQNLGLIDTPVAGGPLGTQVAPGGGGDALPTGLDVFQESPGFQFRQERGEGAINRALAARGAFFSGQAVEDLTEFNSGLASQEFNNFFNRLNALRTGTSAAATTSTAAGAASSSNIANLIQTGGVNRASGIVGAANAANQGLAGLSSALTGGINNALLNRGAPSTANVDFTPLPPIQNPALNFVGG